ncbi:histone deacetylase family protein [Paracoccus cavernae]|uniref:histone deacetylase family protein n=1 Tax=Paracoccus cavernae TaxID=1571207 RepID=UPI0035F3A6B9
MTLLYTHASAFDHVTPAGHPEQIARMKAVLDALDGVPVTRLTAPAATDGDLLRCHPQAYLDRIRAALPDEGITMLDGDTYSSHGGFAAASHAVGGVCAAVDAVLAGRAPNAFVAMRPPGHHAERETPMGFCILGSVAIAAKRALDHHGLDRVAVLDFDVHHGNGTQDLLWDDKRAFFASTQQMPLFPGTGKASETGAFGQVTNLPLAPQTGGVEARAAWQAICARLENWRPQLVIVSAGFDSHRADPLASLAWDESDFTAITRMICDTAAACSAPVVSALEGGYDLDALGRSVRAHVDVLTEVA